MYASDFGFRLTSCYIVATRFPLRFRLWMAPLSPMRIVRETVWFWLILRASSSGSVSSDICVLVGASAVLRYAAAAAAGIYRYLYMCAIVKSSIYTFGSCCRFILLPDTPQVELASSLKRSVYLVYVRQGNAMPTMTTLNWPAFRLRHCCCCRRPRCQEESKWRPTDGMKGERSEWQKNISSAVKSGLWDDKSRFSC